MLSITIFIVAILQSLSFRINYQEYDGLATKTIETLRNQHVVMIGDSLMRYHYISLVYLLRFHHVIMQNIQPNPANEHQWESCPIFLRSTTNALLYPFATENF